MTLSIKRVIERMYEEQNSLWYMVEGADVNAKFYQEYRDVKIAEINGLRKAIQILNDTYKMNEPLSSTPIDVKVKTLKDCLPYEAAGCEFTGLPFRKYIDVAVVKEIDAFNHRWPGRHKNVNHWYILENGKAVGFNENPSVGWSFPVINHNFPMWYDCCPHKD
jgi:hypothetical protein